MKNRPKQYATAEAFRTALEKRLDDIAKQESINLQRLRRQVSFDRLLARLFSDENAPWLLKGGYAMELRLQVARATKDIDLSVPADAAADIKQHILEELQNHAAVNLNDYFVFSVTQSSKDVSAAPEGGGRYPITASMADRTFTTFHVDIGIGDPVIEPTEKVTGRDWLGFAGIAPVTITAISKEQQFAEKLYVYTIPRKGTENSRVKDLVDLALLSMEKLNPGKLKKAIQATFGKYSTHPIPYSLPAPPTSWNERYIILANECGLKLHMKESVKLVEASMKGYSARRGLSL